MLLNAAARALESAKSKTEAFWWDWLATILYCSVSIEAIGNAYGETIIPQWNHFESTFLSNRESESGLSESRRGSARNPIA